MAKGARNSNLKANNKKLKARVFGPVETARAERLSAKLMELAAQPKPPREKMEVEETAGTRHASEKATVTALYAPVLTPREAADSKDAESDNKDAAKGMPSL